MRRTVITINYRSLVLLVLSAFLLTIVHAGVAGAISKQYFDNDDTNGNTVIAGVVGKTQYVTEASVYTKAYFTKRTGNTITIEDYAFCPANTKYDDNGNSGANGSNITKFVVKIPGKSNNVKYGKKNTNCRDNLTINVNFPTNSKPNKNTGYYEAAIDVDHVAGGNVQNMFRIRTNGNYISHATKPPANNEVPGQNARGSEVTVEQVDATPANINYRIKFGADCRVTKTGRAVISLFDLDNNGGSGAQLNGQVTVSLRADGETRKIKISNDPNPKNVSLNGAVNSARPNGDGRRIYLHFRVEPGEKYVLRLDNVYHNNTVQFNTPFDGIYYHRDCQIWNVRPTTAVRAQGKSAWKQNITVAPGTTVNFRQIAKNNGPATATTGGRVQKNWSSQRMVDNRNYQVVGSYNNSGDRITLNNLTIGATKQNNTPSVTIPEKIPEREQETYTERGPDGEEVTKTRWVTNYYPPDAGTRYCTRYVINPSDKDGSQGTYGSKTSAEACAVVGYVPPAFELYPSVSISPRTYSYYPNIQVNGQITATPAGNVSGSHPWQMYAVRYSGKPDTYVMNGDADSTVDPCDKVPSGDIQGEGCELFYQGTYPPTGNASRQYTSGGPDDAGTYLCFFARVQNPDEDPDGTWRYSDLSCSLAGVSPKVQVRGGDAKALGLIEANPIDVRVDGTSNRTVGSWGEYGVMSLGTNRLMGSGAKLGLPTVAAGSSQSDWSELTFRNNGSYGTFGVLAPHTPVSRNDATVYNGNLNIESMGQLLSLVGGNRRTLVVNGTLTISSNLEYPSEVSSIRNIPRIILIANNVVVGSSVEEIDPWIVTTNLSTCDEVAGFASLRTLKLLDANMCVQKLRFNGPVIADNVYLYRTYDTPDGRPAETFNLRADNFLSSYSGGAISDPVATTGVVKEAPPRF